MASNIKLSTVPAEDSKTTADDTVDVEESNDKEKKRKKMQGFVKIFVRGHLFEMARTTIMRSKFLWQLINDEPNSDDGFYHIDRDPKKFECLMNYLVENHVSDILPCSVRDLYNEALFYNIDLPDDDCYGTTLSYILKNINTYDIRGQLKSFADGNGVFGWVEWRQRISLYIEFHCHRTIDLNIVRKYMLDQHSKQIFMIQSSNQRDIRDPPLTVFRCPKTHHPNKSSKTPPETASSSPSSSESCPESAKDLIKQLTVEHVKTWLQQTRFHHLAETWFTYNVNGKELLEISKTGHLTNGTFMLSEYELVQFKDILNRFGFELELE
ncbi:unnamed protein product [Rotaria sp. Silwood1]|nr:unnamed protein product [Rotaria sp. Silwood1]CAF3802508.1 unnamed protein product [Rotaria sp. Silwood1]CAF4826570.1 unnamed protein product [Rotaria sp. Silwood1]